MIFCIQPEKNFTKTVKTFQMWINKTTYIVYIIKNAYNREDISFRKEKLSKRKSILSENYRKNRYNKKADYIFKQPDKMFLIEQ